MPSVYLLFIQKFQIHNVVPNHVLLTQLHFGTQSVEVKFPLLHQPVAANVYLLAKKFLAVLVVLAGYGEHLCELGIRLHDIVSNDLHEVFTYLAAAVGRCKTHLPCFFLRSATSVSGTFQRYEMALSENPMAMAPR